MVSIDFITTATARIIVFWWYQIPTPVDDTKMFSMNNATTRQICQAVNMMPQK